MLLILDIPKELLLRWHLHVQGLLVPMNQKNLNFVKMYFKDSGKFVSGVVDDVERAPLTKSLYSAPAVRARQEASREAADQAAEEG